MKSRFAWTLVGLQFTACAATRSPDDAAADQSVGFDARTSDASQPTDGRDVTPRDVQFSAFDVTPSDIVGAFGACNTLRTSAVPIEESRVRGEVPAPHGGTIVNGWYVLTSAVIYTTGLEDAGAADAGFDAPDLEVFAVDAMASEAGRSDASPFDDITFGRNGRQEALLISDTSVYRISRRGMEPAVTTNFSLTTSGAHASTTVFCPPGTTLSIDGFDATPTRVVLYSGGDRRVDTYDRQ